jgi:hypothetical protein
MICHSESCPFGEKARRFKGHVHYVKRCNLFVLLQPLLLTRFLCPNLFMNAVLTFILRTILFAYSMLAMQGVPSTLSGRKAPCVREQLGLYQNEQATLHRHHSSPSSHLNSLTELALLLHLIFLTIPRPSQIPSSAAARVTFTASLCWIPLKATSRLCDRTRDQFIALGRPCPLLLPKPQRVAMARSPTDAQDMASQMKRSPSQPAAMMISQITNSNEDPAPSVRTTEDVGMRHVQGNSEDHSEVRSPSSPQPP